MPRADADIDLSESLLIEEALPFTYVYDNYKLCGLQRFIIYKIYYYNIEAKQVR